MPPCWKARAGLYLAKLFHLRASYLVLLSGDVSVNPGPAKSTASEAKKCAFCLKFLNKRQARVHVQCKLCQFDFHLKCLGAEFEHGKCRGCCGEPDESFETNEDYFIPSKLQKVVKLCGLKIAHQNIQSLASKIDHLRLLLCEELNCGLQLLTLSKAWIKQDISDGEYKIPGYKLFRKDRDGNNG